MAIRDFFTGAGNVLKLLNVVEEKVKRLEADAQSLRNENDGLRKEVADLSRRVAVLEEARNSIDERVNARISITLAEWDAQRVKKEAEETVEKMRRQLPGPDAVL